MVACALEPPLLLPFPLPHALPLPLPRALPLSSLAPKAPLPRPQAARLPLLTPLPRPLTARHPLPTSRLYTEEPQEEMDPGDIDLNGAGETGGDLREGDKEVDL